jgi:hypothetical protein
LTLTDPNGFEELAALQIANDGGAGGGTGSGNSVLNEITVTGQTMQLSDNFSVPDTLSSLRNHSSLTSAAAHCTQYRSFHGTCAELP